MGQIKKSFVQQDVILRFGVKKHFHRRKMMLFHVKNFWGVEISEGPPNLPQIEKNQNVTKFCSKMSNLWFFENEAN